MLMETLAAVPRRSLVGSLLKSKPRPKSTHGRNGALEKKSGAVSHGDMGDLLHQKVHLRPDNHIERRAEALLPHCQFSSVWFYYKNSTWRHKTDQIMT